MSTRSSSIGRIVAACSRHPVMVVVLALVLTAAALVFTARNFAMTADVSKLISPQLEWRKRELAFEAAFPQFNNLTLIVVDAATPELAESASRQLAAALEKKPELFHSVRRPDAGPFFEREGLLLLPLDQVRTAMAGLGQMAPFLALLNADPSLRGVVAAMATAAQGVQSEQGSLDSIGPMVGALADAIEKTVAGQPAYFPGRPSSPERRPKRAYRGASYWSNRCWTMRSCSLAQPRARRFGRPPVRLASIRLTALLSG